MPILIGAAVMLSLSMGLRQSLGLFMQPLTRDVHISISDFTLAIAVQNLVWGFLQPVAGALTVRFGFRPIMMVGTLLYIAGLVVLASANGFTGVMVSAGVLIGISLACTASAIAMSVAARPVSAQLRSVVFGIVSAAGSVGAMVSAPLGQVLANDFGWRYGVIGFVVLALFMVPAAWIAGRADAIPLPPAANAGGTDDMSARDALGVALSNGKFLVMTAAFFVCGMQLLFLTTHLPTYLAICGMDPMLSAEALGVIGGFNVLGSLFFGWAGGRWNKMLLLGMIYALRSLILGAYFFFPPSSATTLIFAALMGFLWLGGCAIARRCGGRNVWSALAGDVGRASPLSATSSAAFMGAYGGGVLYDALGSYDLAWRIGVAFGACLPALCRLQRDWCRRAVRRVWCPRRWTSVSLRSHTFCKAISTGCITATLTC